MALFARSLCGALNGNIAVLRTAVGEIVTERKHQAVAFSTFPLLFNVGSVIGPLIGGSSWFTRPRTEGYSASNYYEEFITKYPYALSNIVVCCFLWFSMVVGFLFLEETHETFKDRRDFGIDIGDLLLNSLGFETSPRPWHQKQSELTPLLSEGRKHPHQHQSVPTHPQVEREEELLVQEEDQDSSTIASEEGPQKPESIKSGSPFTPQVVSVIIANCIISLHSITYAEFLPVFLATPVNTDTLKFPFRIGGGFGLEASTIGRLFSSTGIVGMLIILIVFPYIDRTYSTINGFRFSLSIFPLVYFLVPLSIFTINQYNSSIPPGVTKFILYFMTSVKTLASATGMPQVVVLNHRAAAREHRAYVNSVTLSMLALARFIGPIVFGYLMSLGSKHEIAWLGWWIISLISLGGFIQSFTMKDYED